MVKKPTQQQLIMELRRLDGTLMLLDEEMNKIQNNISAHSELTDDDLRRLVGLNEQLKHLEMVIKEVRRTVTSFNKTHKFTLKP